MCCTQTRRLGNADFIAIELGQGGYCNRQALTDLLFQTLWEMSIGILDESHPFFTYITKDGDNSARLQQSNRSSICLELLFDSWLHIFCHGLKTLQPSTLKVHSQAVLERTIRAKLTVTRCEAMEDSANGSTFDYTKCVLDGNSGEFSGLKKVVEIETF